MREREREREGQRDGENNSEGNREGDLGGVGRVREKAGLRVRNRGRDMRIVRERRNER